VHTIRRATRPAICTTPMRLLAVAMTSALRSLPSLALSSAALMNAPA
jgi:hypothetical protein